MQHAPLSVKVLTFRPISFDQHQICQSKSHISLANSYSFNKSIIGNVMWRFPQNHFLHTGSIIFLVFFTELLEIPTKPLKVLISVQISSAKDTIYYIFIQFNKASKHAFIFFNCLIKTTFRRLNFSKFLHYIRILMGKSMQVTL